MDRIVLHLPFRPPTKGKSHRAVKGRVILSHETRLFRQSVAQIAEAKGWPKISEGRWSMLVIATAKMRRHLGELDLPYLDSDACLAEIRDALQEASVIDDDLRIVSTQGEVVFVPGVEPHIVVELVRLTDADAAHTERVYRDLLGEATGP